MSIPKKRKPLVDKKAIQKAIKMADDKPAEKADEQKPEEIIEEDKPKEQKAPEKKKKKAGRPRLAGDRSARITFFITQETYDRFHLAAPQEQYKCNKAGQKIDKSLMIEEAIKAWLDNKGY
jgi:hypothetical protein